MQDQSLSLTTQSGKEVSMSRDEAATVYLDNLLGNRRDFLKYHEAAGTLTDDEKSILEQAVSVRLNKKWQEAVFLGP
jgi:hypothetical protein